MKNFVTKFHFLPFQKWPKITGKKFKNARNAISWEKIDLFDFMRFFCQDFLKFSGPLWAYMTRSFRIQSKK